MRLAGTIALTAAVCFASAASFGAEVSPWPPATRECRPWSYWWWMGSAVDRENISRELKRYRDAGWGGVHIIPIYGAKGHESRYIDYLSPKWMEMLRYTVEEAHRLDLGVDMTTGTGWCFGGPNVSERDACAEVVVNKFDLAAGETIGGRLGRTPLQALVAFSPEGKPVELANPAADWRPPSGAWRVYAISQRPCRTPVKRAAPGGQGHMLNPFFPPAIRNYLERFTQAFADYTGPRPRAMYHDSFEYRANWSPELFEQFARRRGYRLEPELAALVDGQSGDHAARLKSDYRETLSDLMIETFAPYWAGWSRQQGFLTRNQAHGSPGNLLDLYAAADIPETEMFHKDRSVVVSKFASSAAHVAGRKLVASETGTWLKEHFNETLADLKDLVDELFLAGVNHVIYHGTCYSPDDVPWPGWLFYASTQMNPRNPIWRDVPALNAYVARCQPVLQSGRPDNDFLIYWPIYDVWHEPEGLNLNFTVHSRGWVENQRFGKLAQRLLDRGYQFDYVSDRQLTRNLLVRGGYRAIVVPATKHMPVKTLAGLLELASAGMPVIFEETLPEDVPGLGLLDKRRAELERLRELIKGRVLVGDVETALARLEIARESMVDSGLRCIRRTAGGGRYYFIANRGARPFEGRIPLATPAAAVVAMDPLTGRSGQAAGVRIELQPGESIILRTLDRPAPRGEAWPAWKPAGNPSPIPGPWRIRFLEGGPELPPPLEAAKLASWTALGAEAAQRFAGAALYSTAFDCPETGAKAWRLDLGKVAESARVRVNGQDLGTSFMPPHWILVRSLKPKANLLEVEVTNLAANRIRDLDRRKVPWRVFHDINLVNIDYKPFDASQWPLRDSGLIGPVTLTPLR